MEQRRRLQDSSTFDLSRSVRVDYALVLPPSIDVSYVTSEARAVTLPPLTMLLASISSTRAYFAVVSSFELQGLITATTAPSQEEPISSSLASLAVGFGALCVCIPGIFAARHFSKTGQFAGLSSSKKVHPVPMVAHRRAGKPFAWAADAQPGVNSFGKQSFIHSAGNETDPFDHGRLEAGTSTTDLLALYQDSLPAVPDRGFIPPVPLPAVPAAEQSLDLEAGLQVPAVESSSVAAPAASRPAWTSADAPAPAPADRSKVAGHSANLASPHSKPQLPQALPTLLTAARRVQPPSTDPPKDHYAASNVRHIAHYAATPMPPQKVACHHQQPPSGQEPRIHPFEASGNRTKATPLSDQWQPDQTARLRALAQAAEPPPIVSWHEQQGIKWDTDHVWTTPSQVDPWWPIEQERKSLKHQLHVVENNLALTKFECAAHNTPGVPGLGKVALSQRLLSLSQQQLQLSKQLREVSAAKAVAKAEQRRVKVPAPPFPPTYVSAQHVHSMRPQVSVRRR